MTTDAMDAIYKQGFLQGEAAADARWQARLERLRKWCDQVEARRKACGVSGTTGLLPPIPERGESLADFDARLAAFQDDSAALPVLRSALAIMSSDHD